MATMDGLSSVIEWAYEPFQIPYHDPLTGNQSLYIPDFWIKFVVNGELVQKLVEVKPMHEALAEHARNSHDAAIQARNMAKWQAAQAWCLRHNAVFEFMTEREMYNGNALRKGRANPVHAYAAPQNKQKRPKVRKSATQKLLEQIKKNRKRVTKIKARTGVVPKAPKTRRTRKV